VQAYGDAPLLEKLPSLAKSGLIVLAFGGGLIPALLGVNGSIGKLLSGDRTKQEIEDMNKRMAESDGEKLDSLDDIDLIRGQVYIEDDVGKDEETFGQPLIKVRKSDVTKILAVLNSIDDFTDWGNLPSTKVPNLEVPTDPPMWLPRATFKASVRSRIKGEVPDRPLDVIFDSISSGAGVITRSKADAWLSDMNEADNKLRKLNEKYVGSKAITVTAILLFAVLQISAFGTLFVAPILREFFNIDIGFGGSLGTCAETGCSTLF